LAQSFFFVVVSRTANRFFQHMVVAATTRKRMGCPVKWSRSGDHEPNRAHAARVRAEQSSGFKDTHSTSDRDTLRSSRLVGAIDGVENRDQRDTDRTWTTAIRITVDVERGYSHGAGDQIENGALDTPRTTTHLSVAFRRIGHIATLNVASGPALPILDFIALGHQNGGPECESPSAKNPVFSVVISSTASGGSRRWLPNAISWAGCAASSCRNGWHNGTTWA
jgi:hypothetical protein